MTRKERAALTASQKKVKDALESVRIGELVRRVNFALKDHDGTAFFIDDGFTVRLPVNSGLRQHLRTAPWKSAQPDRAAVCFTRRTKSLKAFTAFAWKLGVTMPIPGLGSVVDAISAETDRREPEEVLSAVRRELTRFDGTAEHLEGQFFVTVPASKLPWHNYFYRNCWSGALMNGIGHYETASLAALRRLSNALEATHGEEQQPPAVAATEPPTLDDFLVQTEADSLAFVENNPAFAAVAAWIFNEFARATAKMHEAAAAESYFFAAKHQGAVDALAGLSVSMEAIAKRPYMQAEFMAENARKPDPEIKR